MRKLDLAVIAEDNRISRVILREILEQYGAQVIEAADGEEAWEVIVEHEPDLVISDVLMPKCDGFALAQRIHASDLEPTPLVFLTSAVYKSRRWVHEALTTYCGDEFLVKPVNPATIGKLLAKHFDIVQKAAGAGE